MIYLHDSCIRYHGQLKSSNILIDSRWSCRLADYGLRRFREGEKPLYTPDEQDYYYRKPAQRYYLKSIWHIVPGSKILYIIIGQNPLQIYQLSHITISMWSVAGSLPSFYPYLWSLASGQPFSAKCGTVYLRLLQFYTLLLLF